MKKKQKIIFEIAMFILLYIIISAYLSVSYYLETKYWHYDHGSLELTIIIFAIYNCIRILKLKNKKIYLKYAGLEIIQFIVTNLVLTFFVSVVLWIIRDKKLIEVTKLYEYIFSVIYLLMFFHLLLISFVLVSIFNAKKLYRINREIFLRFFPLKISIFLLLIAFSAGNEMLCPWNPLIDTQYSKSFYVYNIDKIENGMTKEEVVELIGEPLNTTDYSGWVNWTRDGKSLWSDYEWLKISIKFEDGVIVEKDIYWMDD